MRSVSTARDELFITLLLMFADSITIINAVITALMSGDIKQNFFCLSIYKSNKNVFFFRLCISKTILFIPYLDSFFWSRKSGLFNFYAQIRN
jgi:hypothetical protein